MFLYLSDYAFTIVCARLYRSGAMDKFVIEGSFELTPYFQGDVDSLKLISPRFVTMLLVSGLLLTLIWFLNARSTPEIYEFVLGSMILLEFAIHHRHIRNFFMFRKFAEPDCVRGRIEYSRPFVLQTSSTELFAFSGLFLFLFAFTPSWFVLGGAASCAMTAAKHRNLARRTGSKARAEAQTQASF